jgi:hypothetical protein
MIVESSLTVQFALLFLFALSVVVTLSSQKFKLTTVISLFRTGRKMTTVIPPFLVLPPRHLRAYQ